MAFVREETYRRPTKETPWWRAESVYKKEVTRKAMAAGDLVSQSLEVTDDPLVAKYQAVWQDREAWQRWVADDPVVQAYNDMINAFHERFGIITERREYFL
jgi:fumarate reductase subunit C